MTVQFSNDVNILLREASRIDFVHEKRHMFVSLETPSPPLRNVTHSYRYFVLIVHIS